ncbi:MAG: 3,4-dihydroxy-2-butanone-4-phosphate synthase [Flavobacterium sp.]|nr:3,4-dihydroxy-2-butanone-4-phosphate synthase [Flavobacterium sp.]
MIITEKQSPLSLYGIDSKTRVENAVNQLRLGKGILLMDNEDRENEGDLIFSAQNITVADMALMIRNCSGIVCLCLTDNKADELHLSYMVEENTSLFQTPFTVSIDAKNGITTGVSAADRIKTIQVACQEKSTPDDLVKPGHLFPLKAHPKGVLGRNGHTEGSIDLMKLAGLKPQAVLCELMNEDGSMAQLAHTIHFAQKYGMTVLSIEDIVYYRKFVSNSI